MFSKETEKKLLEIFMVLSLGEEKINKLKQNIFANLHINPIKLFINLDLDNVGYLSKNNFISLFKFFSINFTSTDVDYIFFFYDKNEDDALGFDEFLDLIISDSNYFYKKIFKNKFKNNGFDILELNGDLEPGTEKLFMEILIEEINLARKLNNLVIDIKRNNDFVIENLFYELKSYNYITSDSLKAFFDRNELNYDDKFIKNIFNRFNSKNINGKIVFKKFKYFFDISNCMNNSAQIYLKNFMPSDMSQTRVSDDLPFNDTNNNKLLSSNADINFFPTFDIKNNYNNKLKKNFEINEDDIQFKCSHLSRSGSIESFHNELKNSNCKYIPKNKRKNNLYKIYLREKRSKSLEKSLRKTLNYIRPIFNKCQKTIYNDKKVNYDKNDSFSHEDLPVKMPIRLDKNLVKKQISSRNIQLYKKKETFNFCYGNNIQAIKKNHHKTNHDRGYINYDDIAFNKNIDDIVNNHCLNNNFKTYILEDNLNNHNFKTFTEDIGPKIHNRKYYI